MLTICLAAVWLLSLSFLIQLHKYEFGRLRIVFDEHSKVDSTNVAHQTERKSSIANISSDRHNSSKDVHIVFSTDCSGYQHWQSIAAYYSIKRSGHLGPVTRIASGCGPSQQDKITAEMQKIYPDHFRVHFTPSFALAGTNYKYSNKPGGLYHWITHVEIKEAIVALIDPDMMLLRPITPELGVGLTAEPVSRDLVQYKDENGVVQILRKKKLPELPLKVEDGTAAGQHFGIGTLWVSSGMKDARKDFKDFNLTAVCGEDSPCLNTPRVDGAAYTTREQAANYYSVGPVYICTTSDWKRLLPRWHKFTPLVHEQYPKLLAEMYGFTMAAADRQLKFALVSSWMVSDAKTMSPTESWLWIDEYGNNSNQGNSARSVCDGATSHTLPTETLGRLRNYGHGSYGEGAVASGPLPVTLHYCQRYLLANHVFAKHQIDHNFFSCDGEPLKLDVEAIMHDLDSGSGDKVQKRTAFMLCHLIPLMNMALDDYKSDACR